MWILFHSEGKSLCLLPGKQYVIGRKSADLVLENDQSVSRKHAVISVSSNKELDINVPPSTLKLVDENSKYGTFVMEPDTTWGKLSPGKERILVDKDTVRFGLLKNEWRVLYVPLIVTMSNLSNDEKHQLRRNLMHIDGHMTKVWSSNLTHLTMKSITLTIKAICTLACGKPIVTPEYWSRYLEMASNNQDLPGPEAFIPPLKEPLIDASSVSLAVNDARRCVFQGKHFVFASRIDLKELGCMVTAAGGTTAAFDEYTDSFDQLCLPHVVVISCSFITTRSAPTQQQHLVEPFNDAKSYLESRGRRTVADQEIGYAILYCSTEIYCNPKRNLTETLSTQAQSLRPTLDFSSQAIDEPTQSVESNPRTPLATKVQTNKQPVVQRAGIHSQDSHTNDSTYVTQASCAGSVDLFASPIKVERVSEKIISKPCEMRSKRVRSPELRDTPDPKRSANVSIKVEREDDFTFTTPVNNRARSSIDRDEIDDFSFSSTTKPKLEVSACLNESTDLFASQVNDFAPPQLIDETTPRRPELSVATPQKRKKPVHDSPPSPPLKKRAPSPHSKKRPPSAPLKKEMPSPVHRPIVTKRAPPPSCDTSLQDTSSVSRGPVSLVGFLSTTLIKSNCQEMDDLADSVKDIFLIEEKLLVIREKTRLSVSLNETKNTSLNDTMKNFKRFQKIFPINHKILPRIIGGKDLYVFKGDIDTEEDSSLDDSQVDEDLEKETEVVVKGQGKNKDVWHFPASVISGNKSKRAGGRTERRK